MLRRTRTIGEGEIDIFFNAHLGNSPKRQETIDDCALARMSGTTWRYVQTPALPRRNKAGRMLVCLDRKRRYLRYCAYIWDDAQQSFV